MTDTLRDKLIQKGWVTPFNADTLVRLIEEHYADEPAEPPLYARQTGTGQWEGADHPSGPWRKVLPADLARWGNPEPAPPADGEVARFRALCAELLSALEREGYAHWVNGPDEDDLCLRARAALADEPAVPEGREPAAVTGQPSDEEGPSVEEVEGLCEEHCFNVEGYESIECLQGLINEAIARWGNLKGSLTSSPPADGEVAELVAWLRETGDWIQPSHLAEHQRYKRTAELLQRQALVPVSVSEQPWEREGWCDAEGRCWAGTRASVDSTGDRDIDLPPSWELREVCAQDDVCLPAHALPLPEVSNG